MYLLSLAVRVAAGAAVVRPLRLVHSPVPSQSRSSGNCRRMEMEDGHRKRRYLGCLSKKQLLVLSGVAGLVVLLVAIIVPTVLLSRETDPSVPDLSFATDGDMLDFLVQSGTIKDRDGLLATWFHRANSKDEMNRALASEAMVLEADVTLQGYGTPAQKPIPIMAHPPNVTSDNTLDQWLDAVLNTRKGIKLDFKSLASVGLSLDLLLQKNSSRGIHRPVWLNADVLKDPLVPGFIPSINGTQFLELVQEKFPNVTLSLGWMVLGIYNRKMVEEMYALVKDLPQRVTFPIQSLFMRKGWPHISWLLSQSSRFSLTLWQSSVHPSVSDLLFVRDNSHPGRVYYDIYEPTLTAFRRAVEEQGRLRRFYPGGDLMDFLSGAHTGPSERALDPALDPTLDPALDPTLDPALVSVSHRASLEAAVKDGGGGMLVLRLERDPLSGALTLEDVLEELSLRPGSPWGLYVRLGAPELLGASLSSLMEFYRSQRLYRPVWIGMEPGPNLSQEEFVSRVEQLFPYCTIVLNKALRGPGLSQRVALHLRLNPLDTLDLDPLDLHPLDPLDQPSSYDVIVETDTVSSAQMSRLKQKHKHVYVFKP